MSLRPYHHGMSDFAALIRARSAPLDPVPTETEPHLERLDGVKAVLFDVYGTLGISGSGDVGVNAAAGRSDAFVTSLQAAGLPADIDGDAGVAALRAAIEADHAAAKARGVDYPEGRHPRSLAGGADGPRPFRPGRGGAGRPVAGLRMPHQPHRRHAARRRHAAGTEGPRPAAGDRVQRPVVHAAPVPGPPGRHAGGVRVRPRRAGVELGAPPGQTGDVSSTNTPPRRWNRTESPLGRSCTSATTC